jgi:hypothetical protein
MTPAAAPRGASEADAAIAADAATATAAAATTAVNRSLTLSSSTCD